MWEAEGLRLVQDGKKRAMEDGGVGNTAYASLGVSRGCGFRSGVRGGTGSWPGSLQNEGYLKRLLRHGPVQAVRVVGLKIVGRVQEARQIPRSCQPG